MLTTISSRLHLGASGDGASLAVEVCGRCPSPSLKLATEACWESRVWNHEIDRSGDIHVEVNCPRRSTKTVGFLQHSGGVQHTYEYPLTLNISLFLVREARVQLAVDGQVLWTSQSPLTLPTRAHIINPYPQRCRNPPKCTWVLIDLCNTRPFLAEADAVPPPRYYIRAVWGHALDGSQSESASETGSRNNE